MDKDKRKGEPDKPATPPAQPAPAPTPKPQDEPQPQDPGHIDPPGKKP